MFEPMVASLITDGARLLTGVETRWAGCSPEHAQRIYFEERSESRGLFAAVVRASAAAAHPDAARGGG